MEITFVIKRNVNVTYIYKLPLSDKPVVTKLPEMLFFYIIGCYPENPIIINVQKYRAPYKLQIVYI